MRRDAELIGSTFSELRAAGTIGAVACFGYTPAFLQAAIELDLIEAGRSPPEAAAKERGVWKAALENREIQLRSVKATLEGGMDIQGILGIDGDVRNGFDGIKVTFDIDADATPEEIRAVVAQSQKRSAVYDVITNPTNISVEVR